MRIAAIDPGGTTGAAVIDTPITITLLLQHKNLGTVLQKVFDTQPDEIVVEKFIVYPAAGRYLGWSITPAELVGIIKAEAEQRGVPVVEQAPSQKHGALVLLQPLGLYRKGRPHAMDALAHAVYRSLYGHGFAKHPDVQAKLQRFLEEGEHGERNASV